MPAERRRFPLPWNIEKRNASCFIVIDANRFPVCYVYFEFEPGRRSAANLMTRDEARRVAANIARPPDFPSLSGRKQIHSSQARLTVRQRTQSAERSACSVTVAGPHVCSMRSSNTHMVSTIPQARSSVFIGNPKC
jgi:hypothetical protein